MVDIEVIDVHDDIVFDEWYAVIRASATHGRLAPTAAEVELNVLPSERGRGVGAALWEWTLAHCRGADRTVFQCEVNVPDGVSEQGWPGLRFARSRGFVTANVEDHFALDAAAAFARVTRPVTP